MFAGLDLGWLSEHLKERGLSPTSPILIADREGNIIARLPNPETLFGKNMRKSQEAIMDGNTAGEEAVGVDGISRIFGYVPPALPPRDFLLSAGQTKAEAFAAIDGASMRGIGLIVFWPSCSNTCCDEPPPVRHRNGNRHDRPRRPDLTAVQRGAGNPNCRPGQSR
jgi:hypothetical protein